MPDGIHLTLRHDSRGVLRVSPGESRRRRAHGSAGQRIYPACSRQTTNVEGRVCREACGPIVVDGLLVSQSVRDAHLMACRDAAARADRGRCLAVAMAPRSTSGQRQASCFPVPVSAGDTDTTKLRETSSSPRVEAVQRGLPRNSILAT